MSTGEHNAVPETGSFVVDVVREGRHHLRHRYEKKAQVSA
ncbi:hypothetical protein FHS39_000960 [Streptomyces olivoverticillatus]|uniref:Uncharacterized protein n=1 Tax=Streptomyces olivoverticillatus TaxID=66427 RepID=A0A7W7LKN8_9ACTN|nr:hypothetical protein [Streptomyces olivoverticillatus]